MRLRLYFFVKINYNNHLDNKMHRIFDINKYLQKGDQIMSKINVALIFGGKSGEHEVSLLSTSSICKHINRDKYNVFTIGITKEGRWMFYDGNEENIKNGSWVDLANQNVEINLIPSGNKEVGLKFEDGRVEKIDVLFPVLHGPYGEDGTIQGLFEIAFIPFSKTILESYFKASSIPTRSSSLFVALDIPTLEPKLAGFTNIG